jgi:hypothetical protein
MRKIRGIEITFYFPIFFSGVNDERLFLTFFLVCLGMINRREKFFCFAWIFFFFFLRNESSGEIGIGGVFSFLSIALRHQSREIINDFWWS